MSWFGKDYLMVVLGRYLAKSHWQLFGWYLHTPYHIIFICSHRLIFRFTPMGEGNAGCVDTHNCGRRKHILDGSLPLFDLYYLLICIGLTLPLKWYIIFNFDWPLLITPVKLVIYNRLSISILLFDGCLGGSFNLHFSLYSWAIDNIISGKLLVGNSDANIFEDGFFGSPLAILPDEVIHSLKNYLVFLFHSQWIAKLWLWKNIVLISLNLFYWYFRLMDKWLALIQ